MYWPKFSEEKFYEKLRRAKKRSGVSCTYIRWSKQAGLKLYRSKRERDEVVKRQRIAAEHRLGPRVGEKIEIDVVDIGNSWNCEEVSHRVLYCYFTEHVKIVGDSRWSDRAEDNLRDKLAKIGLYCEDLHGDNVGRRGKSIVCLDFGSEGCYLKKRRRK